MSEFIVGIRSSKALSESKLQRALEESLVSEQSREALFNTDGIAVCYLGDNPEGGMLVCSDGVIQPKALEGIFPEVGSKQRMLQELLQDDMRGFLRKHGISAKLTKGKGRQAATTRLTQDELPVLFVSVNLEEINQEVVEELQCLLDQHWGELLKGEHDYLLGEGVMVSYLSCVVGDEVHLHMIEEAAPPIASFYAPLPMYGSAIRVEGMTEDFQEFWHLTYLLGAMGSELRIKATKEDADLLMKMNVEASGILAA